MIYCLRDVTILFLNLLVAKMIKAINSMPYPINHKYALCHKIKTADATKENTIQKMTYPQVHISRRLSKHCTTANPANRNAHTKNHIISSARKTPVRIKFSTRIPETTKNNNLRSLKRGVFCGVTCQSYLFPIAPPPFCTNCLYFTTSIAQKATPHGLLREVSC